MSRPVFVDTLFVVALVNQRDQYHDQALQLAANYAGRPLVVTEAVFMEIGNGLARTYKRKAVAIIDQFRAAPDVEIIPLMPELFAAGFDLYRAYQDKAWGLVDCISFVVMRERGIQDALTFDQHFEQAGFCALMRP